MNVINIYKGDSFEVAIFLNAGDHQYPARYILEGTDSLDVNIVCGTQYSKTIVLTKTLTSADLNAFKDPVYSLTPAETYSIPFGDYYLEAKLKTGDDVITVLSGKKLVIL